MRRLPELPASDRRTGYASRGQELVEPVRVTEVLHYRVRLDERRAVRHKHRHLGVRIERQKRRLLVFASHTRWADIDDSAVDVEPRFFDQEGGAATVMGAGAGIEDGVVGHGEAFLAVVFS